MKRKKESFGDLGSMLQINDNLNEKIENETDRKSDKYKC